MFCQFKSNGWLLFRKVSLIYYKIQIQEATTFAQMLTVTVFSQCLLYFLPPKNIPLRHLVFISFGCTILCWETMLSSDANRPSLLFRRKHAIVKLLEACIFVTGYSLEFRTKSLCHHPIKSLFQLFFESFFFAKTYMNHLNEEYMKFHKEYLYFRTNTTRKKEGGFQNCNLRIIK